MDCEALASMARMDEVLMPVPSNSKYRKCAWDPRRQEDGDTVTRAEGGLRILQPEGRASRKRPADSHPSG